MAPNDQDWKEKYLDLIDTQERQEKRFDEQQEILKRALGRLSVAATGLDEELDKRLDELRKQLRAAEPKPLAPLVSRLESSVVAFDSRRDQRAQVSLTSLRQVSEQLQSISRDKSANKALKGFRKDLKKRVELQHQYAGMLEELANLQSLVIESISTEPDGLWNKLKNKREIIPLEVDEAVEEPALTAEQQDEPAVEVLPDNSVEMSPDITVEPDTAGDLGQDVPSAGNSGPEQNDDDLEGQFLSRAELVAELEADFDRPRHEPAFSRISNHITRVLSELIQGVKPVPCVAEKAVLAQKRISRGLNWFELVPTLEDIRDLVLQAYMAAELSFQEYLNSLNGELEAIGQALGLVLEVHEQGDKANQSLHSTVASELSSLEQSMHLADDVDSLKASLSQNLQTIRSALQAHQTETEDGGLFAQLQKLVKQVNTMEQQAEAQKEELDVQREKAQTDALTGLPNRDAYNMRAHHEVERAKRYEQNLVLAVCDIDNFKSFNDTYGHQTGDRVLKLVAKAVSQRLRSVDFIARYGGEEFVVVLPETEMGDAFTLMDDIRETIANAPLRFKDKPVQLTLSTGLAAYQADESLPQLFGRADKALYQAKNDGRNRCVIASVTPD